MRFLKIALAVVTMVVCPLWTALAWNRITEGSVTSIAVTPNGDIYGVGLDKAVWRG
ncbi:hypothetical protein [Sorangium sp. So ce1151]|uniref:hypothetical protein n=1 Tax=Sorangium sp. So ce1151 TaxID=3133332 RepID=UPI003F628419